MFGRRQRKEEPVNDSPPGAPGDPYHAAREEMIEHQLRRRGVVMHSVLEAMRAVPRHLFVAHEYAEKAYADEALPSIEGQTISQPFMVAVMTQELQLRQGQRVLELGTGTGYQTALLAYLVGGGPPQEDSALGMVYTIERVAALADFAQRRLAALDVRNVQFFVGDGSDGWPRDRWDAERSAESEPQFERIMVTAGAPEIPAPLLRQLKPGGIMVVPVGPGDSQTLLRVEKHADATIETTRLLECRFVPLVGAHAWDMAAYERLQQEKHGIGEEG